MSFFSLRNATVWQGETAALQEVSIDFQLGESVAILGPNGSGKSTLLKLLTGALRPAATPGMMSELFGERFWDLDTLRERIGIVMPEEVNLFHPHEPAFNVVLSAFRGAYGTSLQMQFSEDERQATHNAIARVGLTDYEGKSFSQFSSGEQRRFLIARALVHQPEVIVLDEPTTALDFPSILSLTKTLRELITEGQTLVWVTHQPAEIPPEIQRVVLLKEGQIFADGPPSETLTSAVLSELYDTPLSVQRSKGWHQVTTCYTAAHYNL